MVYVRIAPHMLLSERREAMDNLEQEWKRCMLTGLVHALYRSGMLTQEQQSHLLGELQQTPSVH